MLEIAVAGTLVGDFNFRKKRRGGSKGKELKTRTCKPINPYDFQNSTIFDFWSK